MQKNIMSAIVVPTIGPIPERYIQGDEMLVSLSAKPHFLVSICSVVRGTFEVQLCVKVGYRDLAQRKKSPQYRDNYRCSEKNAVRKLLNL